MNLKSRGQIIKIFWVYFNVYYLYVKAELLTNLFDSALT